MEENSKNKSKMCIFSNLSLALLSIALLLFVYGLSDLGGNIHCWIGVGIVFVGFPVGLFSLIRVYRNKTELGGKKRAWTAAIVGFVLFIVCCFSWWGYYNDYLGMLILSLIFLGVVAAAAIVGLAIFLWRRYGLKVSLIVLITALIVLALIALGVAIWINEGLGNMMA